MYVIKMCRAILRLPIIIHPPINNQTRNRSMVVHAVGIPRSWWLPLALRIDPIQRTHLKIYEFNAIIALTLGVLSTEAVDTFEFRFVLLWKIYLGLFYGEVIGGLGFSAVVERSTHCMEGDSFF